MTRLGYTLMTEQAGPKDLVRYAVAAEERGFDFEVASDHYFPWLDSMGHAPYVWSVLGAVAHATQRVELMTYVTCPTMRYHPAVVAQKAATLGLLSDDRFVLGLGSGENLNEHVVGEGWPAVGERHSMLQEAIEIITRLLDGERLTYDGEYYRVDQAVLFDRPADGVPTGVAVSGPKSVARFAPLADHLITTEPSADVLDRWRAARSDAGLPAGRAIGQVPISWDPDADAARRRAHETFRWSGLGWAVNADLPTTEAFDAATSFVRPEDVAELIPCGPDLDAVVAAVAPYWEAGFTDIAVVQVGGDTQDRFLEEAAEPLLARLREAAPAA
ncbi:TIGR03557 family F420-dependent LLM class oxidoreductase [Georgenia sp. MJ170]|uniref:TIGR03557 family F420-dependent LLM class oxidoreductase n=1 Tax=Georgenia sunbinii TaxID=3117728 RepID=UPI002F264296